MKVYKVIITKTVFVEAEDEEEAKELALDEDFMMVDEKIKSVTVSSRKAMRQMFLNESEDGE